MPNDALIIDNTGVTTSLMYVEKLIMKKIAVIFCVFISLEVGSSCGFASSIEDEAKREVSEVVNKIFFKCGDVWSYHSPNDLSYAQFSNEPTIEVKYSQTEADRLNGIEWKGDVTYLYDKGLVRYYWNHLQTWENWLNIANFSLKLFTIQAIKKQGGQWETKIVYMKRALEEFSCSEVPK